MAAVQTAAAAGVVIVSWLMPVFRRSSGLSDRKAGGHCAADRPMPCRDRSVVVSVLIVALNYHLGPSTSTPLSLRISGVLAGLVVVAAVAVTLWHADRHCLRLRFSLGLPGLGLSPAMTVALVDDLRFSSHVVDLHRPPCPCSSGVSSPRSPTSPAPLAMIVWA